MLLPLSATNGHNSLSVFCPKFPCEADVACLPACLPYHFVINPLKSGKTERVLGRGDLVPDVWENVRYDELTDTDVTLIPSSTRTSFV
jgi:hypothetical protein